MEFRIEVSAPKKSNMPKTSISQGLQCLSIHQPWAWLVCTGVKPFENRAWKTSFRGTIAIHASASQAVLKDTLGEIKSDAFDFKLTDFTFGAVIGLVDIVDIQIYGREHEGDFHASGPYCWRIANPRLLKKPIPIAGKQNLFSLDDAVAAKILAAEAYVFDLGSGSAEAAQAHTFTGNPDPTDRYNCAISELEGQVSDVELAKMASRMIELAPENPLGYMHRISLQDVGASEEMIRADFEKLVEIADRLNVEEAEEFEMTLSFCAAQLSDENREEQAAKFWRRLIQVDPENAWYRRGLGNTLLATPETHGEAIVELERAIELSEDDDYDDEDVAYLLSTLAEGYRRTMALDRAKETAERSMKLDEEFPDACYVAARIAIDANDKVNAKALLRKALILEPDFVEAADLLKELL